MIYADIQRLIDYSIKNDLITKDDELVVRNMLMDALHVYDWTDVSHAPSDEATADASIDDILKPLIDFACANSVIEDTSANRDLFDTKLMGIVTPMPREVIRDFKAEYEKSPEAATEWYFAISQKLNYVRAGRIAKDLKWKYQSEYGLLDITVNRSKPEKDPRDIAKAGATKSAAYPKCQLCAENMGYAGRHDHPARQNLRPIPMTVGGGDWYLQYSPYGYYNEHCIVFNSEHIPMVIDAVVFDKLFDFVAAFPHYFVGSNADLPIVGGSILSHEHFQGGHYTFAMAAAPVESSFALGDFPHVNAGVVKWPMSVIRLQSSDRGELSKACAHVLKNWRAYTDESVNIRAFTGDTPHNTITPIARMKDGMYECDLVLRNNITSEDRPLGVYHPNPSLHHIKKENIGLIEVMGLAVLPARLAVELEEVKNALLSGDDLTANPLTASHAEWAQTVKKNHPELNDDNAMDIIRAEVGAVFEQVLCDAGVFKRDEAGTQAFKRFIATL
ncbi:MAG: UDP-glucose--hexose-1-phosphate uridylyltransferase [Ruminococcus sp.]|nr:UDP-glucose--hexose-1-phosphate uridylyltransferase [Ruminococcus sp.]